MKRFWITLLLCLSGAAVAAGITGISGKSSNTGQQEEIKSTDNGLWSFGQLLSYEDETNSVARVETQMSYATDDADILLPDAGFLHTFMCWSEDGSAADAGDVAVRDADTAGTGTILFRDWISAAAYVPGDHNPKVPFNMALTTGLVIDFTTTADVFCTVSYR